MSEDTPETYLIREQRVSLMRYSFVREYRHCESGVAECLFPLRVELVFQDNNQKKIGGGDV